MDPAVYDAVEQSTHDLPLWRALAAQSGTAVLELGSGTGRVTGDLGRRGVSVVGVDNDPAMLAHASRVTAGLPVRTHLADIRSLELGERFDLILAPARVLEAVGPCTERDRVLARLARHLGPGGCLALHVSEPPKGNQPTHSAFGLNAAGTHIWEERLDRERRLRAVTLMRRSGAGIERFGPMRLWWDEAEGWRASLRRVGLVPVSEWRRVSLALVSAVRGEMYWLAVRP